MQVIDFGTASLCERIINRPNTAHEIQPCSMSGRVHTHDLARNSNRQLIVRQKHAILRSLWMACCHNSIWSDANNPNEEALTLLKDLFTATIQRGEGNSCLVLGPRSSGKTCVRGNISNHLQS